MALQTFANNWGIVVSPTPGYPDNPGQQSATIDAAGESLAGIGRLHLPGGPGSSKTISSSGGKIYFKLGAITWANAGTTVRVGIQDVGATGLEDTTYDVYADLVPGTETLTANVVNSATMESGTKTISHGDLIAVVIEMTARGGADSIVAQRYNSAFTFPYITIDSGSGPAAATGLPDITIEFDDGTMGTLGGNGFCSTLGGIPSYDSADSPDEYALIFQIPFKAQLLGFQIDVTGVASTEDFEVILYSDPLGTPSVIEAITVDASYLGGSTGFVSVQLSSHYELSINTNYAVAVRPTTTGPLSVDTVDFGSGNGNLRKPTMLGTNWSLGSRTDQSGAFSSDTTILPKINLVLNKLDDGVSAGGSMGVNQSLHAIEAGIAA